MSSALAATANAALTGSGRPKRPGWWWKRRKERLKKQKQAAEDVPRVQEIPTTVQNNSGAGSAVGAKKKKSKGKRRKNKKKVKVDNTAQLVPTSAISGAGITEEEQPTEEAVSPEQQLETISDGPLFNFFAQYEGFVYRPSSAPTHEFRRLCRTMDWTRKDLEAKEAHDDFGHAMVSQFNYTYGEDEDDLTAWQKLCRRIGIDPIPNKLEEAKERVFNTHVNLIDLTTPSGDAAIRIFPSELALSKYTRRTKKVFPQSGASGTLLYSLLRRIRFPPPEGSRRNANNVIVHPG